MPYETIWEFNTANFRVTLEVAPEDMDPADSFCFDEDIAAVRNGEVEWFQAKVAVYFDGNEVGADYLGGCAYKSVHEFQSSHRVYRQGDYFCDMVSEAIHRARATISKQQSIKLRVS